MKQADIETILYYLQRVVPRGHTEEEEISRVMSALKNETKKKTKV